jgi:hypothetical protein
MHERRHHGSLSVAGRRVVGKSWGVVEQNGSQQRLTSVIWQGSKTDEHEGFYGANTG